jgi:hypothetical protein
MEKKGMPPEQIAEALRQAMADPVQAQAMTQQVGMENVPSQMNMDITIEPVPDVANLAAEQFQGLVELARAGVQLPPKAYVKASNLRNKSEILEEMDSAENPQAQQAQAEAAAAQMKELVAKIDKLVAETEKIRAETAKVATEADMMAMPLGQIQLPQIANGGPQPMPNAMTNESFPT